MKYIIEITAKGTPSEIAEILYGLADGITNHMGVFDITDKEIRHDDHTIKVTKYLEQ